MRHALCWLGLASVGFAAVTAFMSGAGLAAGREETPSPRHPDAGVSGRDVLPPARLPEPLTPESHVPPRSPDLGQRFLPLTPSIGPGSRGLGPEAGREPARPRSEAGAGSAGDTRSRR